MEAARADSAEVRAATVAAARADSVEARVDSAAAVKEGSAVARVDLGPAEDMEVPRAASAVVAAATVEWAGVQVRSNERAILAIIS